MENNALDIPREATFSQGDRERIERIRAGDSAELAKVRDHCRRVALQMRLDPHTADDVAQDAAFKIWKRFQKDDVFRFEAKLTSYIHAAARNTALKHIERRPPLAEEEPEEDDRGYYGEADAPNNITPEDMVRIERNTAFIEEQLETLPRDYRRILKRRIDGQNYDRIAAHERLKVGTVRSRLSKARKQLTEACEPAL